jgi:hypothetical protein
MCCFAPTWRDPIIHWIGWVGPIYGLGIVEKRKTSVPDWNQIPIPGHNAAAYHYADWAILAQDNYKKPKVTGSLVKITSLKH